MTDASELDALVAFAEDLAEASRGLLREAALGAVRSETKGDGSPVTAVDRAVEDRLRAMIAEAHPDHGIVGEERGASAPERDLVWVLDPIDGTLPFMAGLPVYGTLIALLRDRAPILGVIEMPATAERWLGCRGRPTTRNGEPVQVIGRSPERLKPFVDHGAEPAVGDVSDAEFLTHAFKGADAVFALIPPNYTSDDFRGDYNTIGANIVTAIQESGVKHVLFLSSHMIVHW